jgi:uncharacterized membrane protein YphA (DoxX/SURF4 family)
MMQSSPLNFRRVVIWIGRLILGPIFIYAGYSKAFLPNTHFWPWFMLKFSLATNIANFAFQVDAFQMLPGWGVQFVAHTLPFTEIFLGVMLLIGWRLRIWAPVLTVIMIGFTCRRPACLPAAHEHQLRLLRHSRADRSEKNSGRYRHVCSRDPDDLVCIYRGRQPHPWSAPQQVPSA